MRTSLFAAALAVGTMGLGATAQAEGWNVRDFGPTADRAECMAKADNVIRWYEQTYYSSYVTQLTWTSYGYDMTPGDNDTLIMCPYVNGVVNAFLVIHGGEESERTLVADRLEDRWNSIR